MLMRQHSTCVCKKEKAFDHLCQAWGSSTCGPCNERPHHRLRAIHPCSLRLAQMAVIHRGYQPLPLQIPGEGGLLLCFIVRLGVGVWISVFSLSNFDLTPIPDSWSCSWTWHSALPLCKSGMGRRRMGLRRAGLNDRVCVVLCARQMWWPSWFNTAQEVMSQTEDEECPEGKQLPLDVFYCYVLLFTCIKCIQYNVMWDGVSASW